MREPRICFCAVPVLLTYRNPNDSAWNHADGFFAFFLVPTGTRGAQQNLFAGAVFTVVDMPVVSATRFECHIVNWYISPGQRG